MIRIAKKKGVAGLRYDYLTCDRWNIKQLIAAIIAASS
jgi:hypothetical protein